MIAPGLKQRIRKIDRLFIKAEEVVSIEWRKREKHRAQLKERFCPQARQHATAVAAVVLFGEPQIDEPLIHAWERALQHLGITLRDENGRACGYPYKKAADELYSIIVQDANESEVYGDI